MINTYLKMAWLHKPCLKIQHPPQPRDCPRDIESSQIIKGGGERRAQQQYLLCNGRELEDVESFVIHGGTLVDVDDHAGFAAAAEEALQVVRQLALPEGNVLQQPERKVRGGRRHGGQDEVNVRHR